MIASPAHVRRFLRATLLVAALVPAARGDDDVVQEDEPAPAQVPAVGGQVQGGRVIIMPGLRLQVGGQGQVQVRGVPPAVAGDGAEGHEEPYLGVVASPVPEPVRAQLDLPEGVGVSIDAVAAGGPAAKAGVRQFDVIHKFNDQVVCSPEQLTTLVKVAGAGTTVPLTIVRGGRERVVEAVIEERFVPDGAGEDDVVGALPAILDLEQMIPAFGQQGGGPPVPAEIERKLAEALARARAGGMMPGIMPGVRGNVQVLTIGPNAQSATVVCDARGTVEIREADGKKTVIVKDPAGTEVHAGPLESDEDFEEVPEEYRDWVREVDAGRPAARRLGPPVRDDDPEAAEGADEEPAAASARGPGV